MSRHDPELRPDASESVQIPGIAIAAFCDTQRMADTVAAAAADRRMARAKVEVRLGSIAQAIDRYRDTPTPDLLLIESCASVEDLLKQLEALAEVCEPDTKVMVVGASNDVMLYRTLLDRGISDYVVGPVEAVPLIASIGRIYRGVATKLGRSYVFVAAKGGAGSSTVAHNVASVMARRFGSDVILADMDLPFGTGSLDFNVESQQDIAAAIADSSRIDQGLLEGLLAKCGERLRMLAAPVALDKSGDFEATAFDRLLEVARSGTPNLVLDLPHVWTGWAKRILVAADEVVITATPDLASLRNTKVLVDFLRQARPNDAAPKLVLNQVGVAKRPEIKAADFASAVQLELTACIGFDAKLFGTAANKGQMIADVAAKSAANEAFAAVARAIAGRGEIKRRKASLNPFKLFSGLGARRHESAAAAR